MAARALAVSWAVTPATALNAMPVAAQPSPNAIEPAAGSPPAAKDTAVTSPRTMLAPKLMVRAAASGASRPIRPPPRSSSRPDSSSLRVWRTVMNTIRTARMAAMNAVYLMRDRAPRDVGS